MQHRGWTSRGYLPHCDAATLHQHIVFRLHDSGNDLAALRGSRILDLPNIAAIVESALLHFDGERYRLIAWCVMPNHVHLLDRKSVV